MDMKILKIEKKLCTCCMEEHEVKTVQIIEQATFKNRTVNYEALYMYCDSADELYMDESQIQDNDIKMKNAYRRAEDLLTSEDIFNIRGKYGITQSDLCTLLGWGKKTITRYESHQVQDRAHDKILKKLDSDPEWFLSLLKEAKGSLTAETYQKYLTKLEKMIGNGTAERIAKNLLKSGQTMEFVSKNTELSFSVVEDIANSLKAETQQKEPVSV